MIPLYEDIADVKLISYTQPADGLEVDLESVSDLIAYCARVSNPESQMKNLGNERLINYLITHQHWSPLEMVDITLKIKSTRDISHQAVRHVTFRPQEFSQRYANVNEMGEGFCLKEARRQDNKNRQNSINDLPEDIRSEWLRKQEELISHAAEVYAWATENDIAKECARVVLPEGLTTTTYFFKGSVRSWIHYISLRAANGTQKEHMLIAEKCAEVISKVFPVSEYTG